MSGASSPRRRAAAIAASVSIGLAGVAWAGCGESDEEQAIDEAQQQIEDATEQIDEESQQAIEDAAEQAGDLQEDAEQQLDEATGE